MLQVCQILSTAAVVYEKMLLISLQQVNDLEDHSRSSEIALFNRPYITYYHWSVLHHFKDITYFIVHMNACDLKKSFNHDMAIEIIGYVNFLIHV